MHTAEGSQQMAELDPMSFDRALSSAARNGVAFLRSLQTGAPGAADELARALEHVANSEALHWVRELPAEDATRVPALRWLHCLIDLRVNARAVSEVARVYRRVRHSLEAPAKALLSVHEMVTRALSEPGRREEWLRAVQDNGRQVQDASHLLWERRVEVSKRMGFESPQDIAPAPGLALASHLAATTEILEHSGAEDLASFLEVALATGASEGWPVHLSPRSLTAFFASAPWFDGLRLRFGGLPQRIAPASFLRGLGQLGGLFFEACASDALPFSLSRDPYGLGNQTSGALFVWMGISTSFLRRNLSQGPDRAREHRRALARAVLLESRAAALRCRLSRLTQEGRDSFSRGFEEHCHSMLGFALPPRFGLVLMRPRVDADQRYLGLLLAASAYQRLRDQHDEDFYRNPRAVEQLRGEARLAAPCAVSPEQIDSGLADMRRLLLEYLD